MEKKMITINVADYYSKSEMYSVMPAEVFGSLEEAFLNEVPTCEVDENLFNKMMSDYNTKLKQHEEMHQS